ncbi:FdhF/YdeP family oxidoreductase [Miltoncostaea oceani]|uniref:FdhF/YdeP family oxidoreductase n=1 Tax=Miltoncostaea oceani TaxID=2843216 RepID=UPI001C3D73BF|nr:FdhF/YdeP family oxidoreductase [Miltoncostaea oceani]
MARTRPRRRDLWVGLRPNGVGLTKPNHYLDMLRVAWENRRALPYASRILRKGVCDGCALGVAGLHDWTIDGVHLCTTRLSLLKVNTMGAMDHGLLADVAPLRERTGAELRDMGRLAYPMVRGAGAPGFTRVSWDEALDLVAGRIREGGGERFGLFMTARGITNEVYYTAGKVARFLGSNNIDNAARICHAPSTAALRTMAGAGATTISYGDLMASDLVVLFGSDVANAQPVVMKYLYLARREGTRVAVVNPYREPGLERYWVPSNAESAVFGTRMTDEFFPVSIGGDIAFIAGVMKVLAATGGLDRGFIDAHTTGWDALQEALDALGFPELEASSGASRADMERFAAMYAASDSAVFVWSMGLTQHAFGSENVRAVIDLALARGNVGRPGAGLMPIRGHSGVQGGAEMGAYATALPGGITLDEGSAAALSDQWGFDVPTTPGLTVDEMVEAAGDGRLDVLWSSGGNFLETLPDPGEVARCLARVPVRVHQDIVVTSQMLIDPGEVVVLLPAATRYEQRDGGTETTTERRIAFSPPIRGPRVGEARTEWEIFSDVAARVDPARAHLVATPSGQAIREEIARVVPLYAGIETLRDTGDQVQWGGPRLCDGWVFPTPDGRARFAVVQPPERHVPEGRLMLSTRRGKQFNSMVFRAHDPLTGADRDHLFISREDARRIGVDEGAPLVVRSDVGEVRARARIAPMRPGNVQMFFPECNPLIARGARDVSGVPDYNAIVEVVPA